MFEKDIASYYSFEEYATDVIRDCTIKAIAAEDYRVKQAVVFLFFQAPNNDRSIEANLLAAVAEEFHFEPEDVVLLIEEASRIAEQYVEA